MTSFCIVNKKITGCAGRKLCMDIGGDCRGQGVLLLHGGGQTRHAWQQTVKKLIAAGYRVGAYDLRGHGDSDWAGSEGYFLDVQVDDLCAVATQFDTPPVLVGASFGGLISLVAAGERAITPAGLVLVDVAPKVNRQGEKQILAFMKEHQGGFASVKEAADIVGAYLPHRPRPRNVNGLKRNLRKRGGRWYWHWDPSLFDTLDSTGLQAQPRFERAAAALDVPTLLVRGALSELVDEASLRDFNSRVPHARFVDVRNAHHMLAGDDNDAFTSAVLSFLSEIRSPSSTSLRKTLI